MAKKGNRIIVRLKNPETGTFYTVKKNRVNTTDKMKLKKFDKELGKHVVFTEVKV